LPDIYAAAVTLIACPVATPNITKRRIAYRTASNLTMNCDLL
jgi:hypothetical protein